MRFLGNLRLVSRRGGGRKGLGMAAFPEGLMDARDRKLIRDSVACCGGL